MQTPCPVGIVVVVSEMTLGTVLRAWRQRVNPTDVGLPAARGERRTPGLRREELAWLAGVSPDYVKRLEQGRARPSRDVVGALARALRVSHEEYDLLARLAGHAAPSGGRVPQHISPGVQRLADRLAEVPLAIYDVTWTLLSANRLWAALMNDLDAATGRDRNVVWLHFTGADVPVHHTDAAWLAQHEQSLTADLREAVRRYPADGELADMVTALRQSSARFAELWEQPTVARHVGVRKLFANPIVGDLALDCDVLTAHDADLRLVMFTPVPGTPDVDKLAMLAIIGTQNMNSAPGPA